VCVCVCVRVCACVCVRVFARLMRVIISFKRKHHSRFIHAFHTNTESS